MFEVSQAIAVEAAIEDLGRNAVSRTSGKVKCATFRFEWGKSISAVAQRVASHLLSLSLAS